MSKERLYLALLIVGTAFWGISFALVKTGVGNGSPFVFLAYKFLAAGLTLALLFPASLKHMNWKAVETGALIAVPLMLGNIFQTIGLQHTSVTNSAFITGLDVLLIPLIKFTLFRRPVANKVWVSCALALCGLYLIVAKSGLVLNPGDIWTAACALCFAAYVLGVGHFAKTDNPVPVVIAMLIVCGAGCAVGAAFDPRADWLPQNMDFWGGMIFAALPATAYMYLIQTKAQRYLSEEKVALTYLCEPIFATLFGIVLLGEALTLRTVLGAGLILTSLVLAEINLRPRTHAGPNE